MYFHGIQEADESTAKAVKINLSRYLLRLEASERRQTERPLSQSGQTSGSSGSAGKIVNASIITIFMTFLMYAPKGRRDYLSADLSIEDEFEEEADNVEALDTIYKEVTADERHTSILGDAERRTSDAMSVLVEGSGVNKTSRGSSEAVDLDWIPLRKAAPTSGGSQRIMFTE